jgi:hypothetical protein
VGVTGATESSEDDGWCDDSGAVPITNGLCFAALSDRVSVGDGKVMPVTAGVRGLW